MCKGERDAVQDLWFEEGALATHFPSTGFPSRAWRPEMTHVPMLPLRVSEDWDEGLPTTDRVVGNPLLPERRSEGLRARRGSGGPWVGTHR